MSDLNVVSLVGRMTREPEVRMLNNNKVCNFSIAVNSVAKNGDGKWEDKGNFFEGVIWGDRAESFSNYVGKGDRIALTGSLAQDRWEEENGTKREKVKIRVRDFQFIEPKKKVDTGETEADF